MKTLETLGKSTLKPEITNISGFGIWMLISDKEYFLSYEDFPWFNDASVKQITNVEEPSPGHFYWPDLDVDLSLEAIKNPEKYPLKFS